MTVSGRGGDEQENWAPPVAHAAWKSWLGALATDADAAIAAALAYDELDAAGRDAWLDALDQDAASIAVPLVALYGPLASVEADDVRKARIEAALSRDESPLLATVQCFVGGAGDERCCLVALPLYLSFVEVLLCRYSVERGVFAAHHEPIRNAADIATLLEDEQLAPASLGSVVDELAHAVLADRREGRDPKPALAAFAHLFGLSHASWETAA